jgi:predicted MFS family arabinose efflux permease
MIHDVGKVLWSRKGFTGILFCLSPVGTAALVNLFSGMTRDFQLADTDPTVVWVNGLAGAGLTAIGSLAGGYLCDRYNRRRMYLLSGALTALCGLGMAMFPLNRSNYVVGVSAYLLVSGLCYAAFSAVVLEAIGRAGEAASTQYTLFSSAGERGHRLRRQARHRVHRRFGPKAPLGTDAVLNVVGVVLLGSMMFLLSRKRPPDAKPDAKVLGSEHDSAVGS